MADSEISVSSDLHSNETVVAQTGLSNRITWQRFCSDVANLCDALSDHDLSEWVLCISDSYTFAVAFFAVMASGNALFLPGNLQPAALARLASPARGFLYDGDAVPGFGAAVLLPLCESQHTNGHFLVQDIDTLRITLLTSGSTGQPKAVSKSLANLLTEVMALEKIWGATVRGALVVATVTHQHIYGLLFRVLWPLFAGNPFDRRLLIFPEEVVASAGPDTVVVSSPTLLKLLGGGSSQESRAIFSSGGLLPLDAAVGCSRVLGHLPFEVFGSTETGGIAWRQQIAVDTPWALFPDVQAHVGADQSLVVQTPYITPSAFLSTGDAVQMIGDRQFVWKGRVDRILKIAEKRISLSEVEAVLVQCDWIQEAAVVVLGEPDHPVLGAVIVLSPAGSLALQDLKAGRFRLQLRKTLRHRLEAAAVPRRYREVDQFPLNAQGKLVQSALRRLFLK